MQKEKHPLGENLKRLRTKKNFSREKFAHISGLSAGYIYKIENGKVNPTISVLQKISEVLGVSVDELIREE